MNMSSFEYHFYEWLIIGKGFTSESFRLLTEEQVTDLKKEYIVLWNKLNSK